MADRSGFQPYFEATAFQAVEYSHQHAFAVRFVQGNTLAAGLERCISSVGHGFWYWPTGHKCRSSDL